MPSWSPDGARIVHIRYPGGTTVGSEIFAMDTTGSSATRLTNNMSDDRHPRYSPDGTTIASDHEDSQGIPQLWLMNSDGTGERQITTGGGSRPAWSPDGSEIVYVSENWRVNTPQAGRLWIVQVTSGAKRQLTY